jgi:hypothetical protein
MPVQPRRSRSPRSIIIGVAGLALGIMLVLALFVVAIPSLTEDSRMEVRLGDDAFVAGNAERRAAAIAADGPILLGDVASGDRDVFVQHLGDDPASGWYVFDARRPGTGRECTLRWEPATGSGDGSFSDPCDGSTVPADGGDLPRYGVEVDENGTLVLDLLMRPTTTTAAPDTTTSTIRITGR